MKDFDFARSVYFHFQAYNAILLQERVYGSGREKKKCTSNLFKKNEKE